MDGVPNRMNRHENSDEPFDRAARLVVGIAAGGCVLLGCAITPSVLGWLAAPDGRIKDPANVLMLRVASALVLMSAITLVWLMTGQGGVRRQVRCAVGSLCKLVWRSRRRLAIGTGVACVLFPASFAVYFRMVNHVNLLDHLEASQPLAVDVLELRRSRGDAAALSELLRLSVARVSAARILPYQLWDGDPTQSARQRTALLEGDLGTAAGTKSLFGVPAKQFIGAD